MGDSRAGLFRASRAGDCRLALLGEDLSGGLAAAGGAGGWRGGDEARAASLATSDFLRSTNRRPIWLPSVDCGEPTRPREAR